MNLFDFDLVGMLLSLPGILVALSFHEYAHAQVAVWLGDDTPKYQGRLSISPAAHLDPMGFFSLLFLGFGWAKPVMINPNNFKKPKRDDILVSLAGPMMNLLLAIVFAFIIKATIYLPESIIFSDVFGTVLQVLKSTVIINVVLMIFNLIPIPPLDGSHVLFGLLNMKNTEVYYNLQRYGMYILLGLIIFDLTDYFMWPAITFTVDKIFALVF